VLVIIVNFTRFLRHWPMFPFKDNEALSFFSVRPRQIKHCIFNFLKNANLNAVSVQFDMKIATNLDIVSHVKFLQNINLLKKGIRNLLTTDILK
jgi:hypothetical protein